MNLLCFIFKATIYANYFVALFYAIKEKEDKKKRYIEKKYPQLKLKIALQELNKIINRSIKELAFGLCE